MKKEALANTRTNRFRPLIVRFKENDNSVVSQIDNHTPETARARVRSKCGLVIF